MPCFAPLRAWRRPGLRPAGSRPVIGNECPPDAERIELPCGKCLGCRTRRAQDWVIRCSLELQEHDKAAFWTGTFSDENLTPTLQRRPLQLFLKRLRRSTPDRVIRFFASGEYGETNGRPHYHAILYGLGPEDAEQIDQRWGLGISDTHEASLPTIAYVAGYVSKKLTLTWDHLHPTAAPFLQMSRGGRNGKGIGAAAKRWPESWRSYAMQNGFKKAVPRYLHESWKQQATTEEQEKNLLEKLKWKELLADTDLEAQERIAHAKREQHRQKRRA